MSVGHSKLLEQSDQSVETVNSLFPRNSIFYKGYGNSIDLDVSPFKDVRNPKVSPRKNRLPLSLRAISLS